MAKKGIPCSLQTHTHTAACHIPDDLQPEAHMLHTLMFAWTPQNLLNSGLNRI